MLAVLAVLCCGVAVSGAAGWKDVTVYRVTPINYTGLVNMDSGDALGDVMFGLSQLVLPVMCPLSPTFLWCENRQYLSGGSAHMVYTEFVVSARDAFGDYAACNPDPDTGIFNCTHFGGTPGGGKCADFWGFNQDCLNGTVYHSKPSEQEECCQSCTDDARCAGYSFRDGTCELLASPLVTWQGAQKKTHCAAGVKSSHHHKTPCWYEDSRYNVTFADFCSRSSCSCDAVEWKSMGVEHRAMCWSQELTVPASAPKQLPAPVGTPTDKYWECGEQIFDKCSWYIGEGACEQCAKVNTTCSAQDIEPLCHPDKVTCAAAVDAACVNHTKGGKTDIGECRECAFSRIKEMGRVRCNASIVNYVCMDAGGSGGHSGNKWEEKISEFACMMNGTWYSNTEHGYCNGTKTPDCWWDIAETKRTVNQSCVNEKVVDTVRDHNPACFKLCPQPYNLTTECVVTCIFDTILGDPSKNISRMNPDTLAASFVAAIANPVSQGGCPEVKLPATATASPPATESNHYFRRQDPFRK